MKPNRITRLTGCRAIPHTLPAVACAVTVLLSACSGSGTQYSRFERIPDYGWIFGDPVKFAYSNPDSLANTSMRVALMHDDSYPYTSVSLELKSRTGIDTATIALTDASGSWLGSGVGNSLQIEAATKLAPAPTDTIEIRHIMRTDTLRGIRATGIFISSVRK